MHGLIVERDDEESMIVQECCVPVVLCNFRGSCSSIKAVARARKVNNFMFVNMREDGLLGNLLLPRKMSFYKDDSDRTGD